MTSLPDHPQRRELTDEVHARPQEPLIAPTRLSYLAMLGDTATRQLAFDRVCELAAQCGATPPAPGAIHYVADMGVFRLKWERHTEFVRYTFIADGLIDDPFASPALSLVPAEWLASLPGQVIAAAHAALLPEHADAMLDLRALSARWFGANVLLGAGISGGAATALTDLHMQPDGFSRFLVYDHSTTPWQAGRIVQRLLEIETYRVLALLALPVARETAPFLSACERELGEITAAMVDAKVADEPVLLGRLTRLEAQMQSRQSASQYRFSAAAAYDELVQARISELRETRIQGLQTFREFTARRFGPAMNTCRTVAARQDVLSQRVARAGRLLSTRVDITNENQNQKLLESMNRRASLQLRLQSTVEGLSVAAVTYYIVGLVGYAAKALAETGVHVRPELAMGLSIPVIGGLVAFGLHRTRRMVEQGGAGHPEP
jgi:uncharacterized membrane-anchored protein